MTVEGTDFNPGMDFSSISYRTTRCWVLPDQTAPLFLNYRSKLDLINLSDQLLMYRKPRRKRGTVFDTKGSNQMWS